MIFTSLTITPSWKRALPVSHYFTSIIPGNYVCKLLVTCLATLVNRVFKLLTVQLEFEMKS